MYRDVSHMNYRLTFLLFISNSNNREIALYRQKAHVQYKSTFQNEAYVNRSFAHQTSLRKEKENWVTAKIDQRKSTFQSVNLKSGI